LCDVVSMFDHLVPTQLHDTDMSDLLWYSQRNGSASVCRIVSHDKATQHVSELTNSQGLWLKKFSSARSRSKAATCFSQGAEATRRERAAVYCEMAREGRLGRPAGLPGVVARSTQSRSAWEVSKAGIFEVNLQEAKPPRCSTAHVCGAVPTQFTSLNRFASRPEVLSILVYA